MPSFASDIETEAGFRSGVARMLGIGAADFATDARFRADRIETKLGKMIAVSDAAHLYLLEFAERAVLPRQLHRIYAHARGSFGFGRWAPIDQVEAEMTAFLDQRGATFEVPLAPLGTPFTQAVWRALRDIPAGETRSYGQMARSIGRPDATRAVARANGANPIAIVIPCHRVLGKDGALTGYGGGLWRKRALLDLEQETCGAGALT